MQKGLTATRPLRLERKILCMVIPTLNEAENIAILISRLNGLGSRLPFELHLVVVDDNSHDCTRDIVRKSTVRSSKIDLIERPRPMGIGSAYITGFEYGLSKYESDYFGEIDADLQHPPEVLIEMCKLAEEGGDVVIASRYVEGGGHNLSFSRKLVSRTANFLAKLFIHSPVSDATSGFRVISARAIKALIGRKVSSKGYAFQIESLYIYKKYGMSFAEVPYVFEKRMSGKTKLEWKEAVRFFVTLVRLGLSGMSTKNRKSNLPEYPLS